MTMSSSDSASSTSMLPWVTDIESAAKDLDEEEEEEDGEAEGEDVVVEEDKSEAK